MKKIYLLLIMFLSSIAASAQNQEWLWARSNSNNADSYGKSVAVGADGSVYAGGSFSGVNLTFESDTYANDGEYSKMFLVKYDAQGTLQWSKGTGGSTGLSEIQALTVDEAGDIFVTGRFLETLTIQNLTLTTSNLSSFAAKFDTNGTIQWLMQIGAADFISVGDITNDGNYIYITGIFGGTAMTFPTDVLNNNDEWGDVFVAKYDLEGNFYWADNFGSSGEILSNAIEVDTNGNLYLAGEFSASATFAGTTVTSQGRDDVFLLKYDNQNQPAWIKSYGSTQNDWALSLAVDADSNVIASYNFSNTVDFEGTSYNAVGYFDSAIIKYDSGGNLQWLKTLNGQGYDYVTDIATSSTGQVLVTGYTYSSNVTFAGSSYVFPTVSNIFLSMINPDGTLAWFTHTGGNDGTEAYGIALDSENNAFITGRGMDITFGNTLLDTGYNMFVAKYSAPALGTLNFGKSIVTIYPNPAREILHISTTQDAAYSIIDLTGRIVIKGTSSNNAIDVAALPSGMYILNIDNITTKFIKE